MIVWLECGRSRDGAVADIMRRTHAAYHYAVRYIKQNNSGIVKQRFANTIYSRIEAGISGVKCRKYEAEKVIYKELLTVTHRIHS